MIYSPDLRVRYNLRQRVQWLFHAACGLTFLHNGFAQPIRHWDVKPSNILLDASRKVAKLSDMGLAKFVSDVQTSTSFAGPRGTFSYLDPNYLMSHKYTPASDVFSFGLVLLQTIMGEPNPGVALNAAR